MNEMTRNNSDGGNSEALMTKSQVAAMLQKSRRTIEHWVNRGYLSSIRIGHSVLFERDQVMRDLKRFESGSSKRL